MRPLPLPAKGTALQMAKITRESKLTFGKHKGTKISMCPTGYIEWMAAKFIDSDLYLWAQAAQVELDARKAEGALEADHLTLEQQADEILRKAGFDP